MTELAASVARKDGEFWEAVRGARERWGIEAQTEIPPSTDAGAYYVPSALSGQPQQDDPRYEEWLSHLSDWGEELFALHKRFIPEDCREAVGQDCRNWLKFLSALVLCDPPIADGPNMPGFPEFCDALDHPHVGVRLLTRTGTLTPPWVSPLLGSVRDSRKVEDLPSEAALLIIAALQQQPHLLRGGTPEVVWEELLRHSPDLTEKLRRLLDEIAPRRIELDHEAGTTANEQEEALKELLKARPDPPRGSTGGSNKRRDPALAVEAAILADRPGWTQKRVAEFHGWLRDGYDYSLATQWIRDGKEIISGL